MLITPEVELETASAPAQSPIEHNQNPEEGSITLVSTSSSKRKSKAKKSKASAALPQPESEPPQQTTLPVPLFPELSLKESTAIHSETLDNDGGADLSLTDDTRFECEPLDGDETSSAKHQEKLSLPNDSNGDAVSPSTSDRTLVSFDDALDAKVESGPDYAGDNILPHDIVFG